MSGTQPTPPAVSTDTMINTYGRVAVSVIIVSAFLLTGALSLLKALPDNAISSYLVNTLGAMAITVVTYWVGSSASSTTHSATIASLATTAQANAVAAPTPAPTTTGTTP